MATNQIRLVVTATDNSSAALKTIANNIDNIKKGVASLTSTTSNVSSGISSVNTAASKTPGLFSRIATGAKSALAIFGGYKIISGIFNKINSGMSGAISRLDTMDLFEKKMAIITHSTEKAAYALDHMKTATKGTAYGLDTAAKAVQNFVVRGMSTEAATKSVETWMDAVAVYGNGTNEALTSVINALGKMRSKGTVEMRHINSMINAGINPVQLYAQATGQAAADVQTQLSEKTLRTEEFLAVVENALQTGAGGVANVTGLAKKMATTWRATFDNMQFAINRGWASLIDGANKLLSVFDKDGLKGVFKSFGNNSESIMTGIGDTMNRAGVTIKTFYDDFLKRHQDAAAVAHNTELINLDIGARIAPDTKEKFKNSFLGVMGNFAEPLATEFLYLANNWAKFKQAVAEGVNQIAPQLGHLFGTVFGQGITSATDLLNKFLQWATLKVPVFFSWVQEKLQWLIDHWSTIVGMANGIFHAFLLWQGLSVAERGILGINSALVTLNKTLGFFTGGALQLPTLDTAKRGIEKYVNKQKDIKLANASTIAKRNQISPITNLGKPDDVIDLVAQKNQLKQPSNLTRKTAPKYRNKRGPIRPLSSTKNVLKENPLEFKSPGTLVDTKSYEKMATPALPITKRVNNMFSGMWKNMTGGFTYFTDFLGNGMRTAMTGVQGFVGKTVTKTSDLMGTLKTKSSDILTTVADNIGSGFKKIGETFSDAGYALKEVLLGIGRMANDKTLSPLGKGISNFIKEGYAPEIAKGKESKKRWGASFHEAFDEDIAGAKNFIRHPIKTVKSGVGKVTGKVTDKAKPVVEGMGVSFHKAFDSDIEWIKGKATSVGTFFSDKLITPIGKAFSKIGGFFTEDIVPAIGWVGKLGSAFMGAVPMIALVTGAIGALAIGLGVFNPDNTLSKGITTFFQNFNDLVLNFGKYAAFLIQNFVGGIIKDGDKLREQGVNLVLSVVKGILTSIPNILATGIRIVGALIAGLIQVLPTLVYQGFMAMGQFIAGIISAIPDILQGVGNMLMALAEFFLTNLPMFIDSGIQLVWNIITGIWGMLGQICGALGDLLKNTWNWLISGEALKTFQDVGAKIIEWMEIGLAKTGWGSWLLQNIFGVNVDDLKAKAAETGAQTASDYTTSLDTTIQSSPIDITSVWNNADISQDNEMAERLAQQAAGNYVGAEQDVLDAADLDTDLITDSAGENVESASTSGTEVGNAYTQSATDSINAGSEQVGQAAQNVAGSLNLSFDTAVVQEQVTNFVNTIAIVFTEQAPLLYQTTGNMGVGAVNEFVAKVNENLPLAYATAIGLLSYFKQGIDDYFNNVRESITLGTQTLMLILQQQTTSFYNEGKNSVMQYAQGFNDNAVQAALVALTFKTMVLEQLRGIPEASYGIGVSTINAFHNGTVATQDLVVEDYSTLAEQIGKTLEERLGTAFSSVAGKIKQEANDTYLGVVSALDQLRPYITQLGDDLNRIAGEKAQAVHDSIYNTVSPLPGEMLDIGQQMMLNLRQGIEDKMQEVVDLTSTLVTTLKDTFKEGLGIHSPSRFMQWIGQMMFAGLIGGLSQDEIKKWTELIVGDLRASFDNGTIDPFDTVDFLKDDTVALIGYLTGVDTSGTQASNGQLTWPIPGYQFHVNSPFGPRWGRMHEGVDLMSGHGNPIVAALPGTVSVSGRYFGYGNAVVLEHGNGIQTRYGHFMGTAVNVGQNVQAGQTVGFSDSTGNSTGDHLHFEIRQNGTPVDPVPYLQGAAMSGVMIDPLANTLQTVYSMYQNSIDKLHWRDGMEGLKDVPGMFGGNYNTAGSGLIEPDWFKNWQPPAEVARWAPQVLEILGMLGQPASLLKGVLWAINGESGGDPYSTYMGDINVIYGGSKGLLQTITPNFERWKNPNLPNDIYDPRQNIWTCLREMQDTYGSIQNVINRRLANGKWSGYAVGTRYVPQDMLAMIHEGEAIIPASLNPYSQSGGDYLGDLVSNMVLNDPGIKMDTSNLQSVANNSNQNISIENNVTINCENGEGAEEIANNIAYEMHKALTRAISIGNAR